MPKLTPLLIGLVASTLLSCGNNTTKPKTDTPQNKDYLIRMDGIDSLKLDMNKSQLEKLLNMPIKLPNLAGGGAPDTVNVKYKGMDVILYFDGSDDTTATLRGIETANPSCKTATGIGTGSDKIAAIDAYPDLRKYVGPVYDVYPARSATKTIIAVMDTASTSAILFHVINKKVASVGVSSYYEYY